MRSAFLPVSLKLCIAIAVLSTASPAIAQDVHVRVSPDVKTGIEGTAEFPTIQMAMDHHPFAGVGPGGRPGRVFIEIAPGIYHERVIVTQNHANITLIGMGRSPSGVVITNSLNAKQAGGTFFTETVEINGTGEKYLLETALRADIGLVRARMADPLGNLAYRGTLRNFNPLIATAADLTMVDADMLMDVDEIGIDRINTPGVYVDMVLAK